MTDASTPGYAPIDIQPVSVDSLIRSLPRSKRGGYVEEIVDEKLKDFASQINMLVDEYNTVVKELAEAVATPPAEAITSTPTHSAFSETEEETAERIAALYRDAQRNAREFVDDARERGTAIVNRAEAEAETLRNTAQEEVESARTALEAQVASTQAALETEVSSTRAALAIEVRTTHERLEAETAQLNVVRDRLTAETQEIFERLRAFHTTQLDTLGEYQASVRFDTPEAETGDEDTEADDIVTEDVDPATESDADDAVAADDDAANEIDEDNVREPVDTDEVSDAASEPEVFTPEEPVEAPEASVTADPADDDLTVGDTDGGSDPEEEETDGRKRRFRR